MAFCRKCGAEMAEDDAFCSKCGASVASTIPSAGVETPSSVNRSFGVQGAQQAAYGTQQSAYEAQPATYNAQPGIQNKNELLQVLQRYRDVIRDLEKANAEATSTFASEAYDEPVRYYTFMRFYWPFLVGAFFAFWIVYIFMARLAVHTLSMNVLKIGLILAIIVTLTLVFVGIGVARNKQDSANNAVYAYADSRRRKAKSKEVTAAEKKQLEEKKRSLEKDLGMLPGKYRNYDALCNIVRLLKFDKAATLQEAMKMTDEKMKKR